MNFYNQESLSDNLDESLFELKNNEECDEIDTFFDFGLKNNDFVKPEFAQISSCNPRIHEHKETLPSTSYCGTSDTYPVKVPNTEENDCELDHIDYVKSDSVTKLDFINQEKEQGKLKLQSIDEQDPIDIYNKNQPEDPQYVGNSTMLNISNTVSRKRSRSKKRKSMKNILLEFYEISSSMKKPKKKNGEQKPFRTYPKKEYYRTKVIRNWKKILRKIKNEQPVDFLDTVEHYFNSDRKILDEAASTENGPKTEGKSKANKEKSTLKTFNNSYVVKLFSDVTLRTSFKIFVCEYFEALMNCQIMCENAQHSPLCIYETCKRLVKKFSFSCCLDNFHSSSCLEKWSVLKYYTFTGLILQTD